MNRVTREEPVLGRRYTGISRKELSNLLAQRLAICFPGVAGSATTIADRAAVRIANLTDA